MIKRIILLYFFFLFGFVLYSYSQIDLNLTLWTNPVYQQFQQMMIKLGYFNRPLSTAIFLLFLFLFFLFYFFFLILAAQKRLSTKKLWQIIIPSYMILLVSYPAFSHDIFNYIFDARIVTKYGLSPYHFTALDFPNDPWTRFMRWTHRYYPYGPLWLILTSPFSFFGFGKFVLTLALFKLLFFLVAIGNVWLIAKLLQRVNQQKRLFGILFFSLNPLVMIESLVSPHNEAVMFFFTLLGLFFLLSSRRFMAMLAISVSALIKFLPIFYLPLLVVSEKSLKKSSLYSLLAIVTFFSLIPVIYLRETYSWYFIPVLGFATLAGTRWLTILTTGISMGTLLRYIPFLYFGDYNPQVIKMQNWLLFIPVLTSIILAAIAFRRK